MKYMLVIYWNIFEHVGRLNNKVVLKEWNRVLKRNGILRIAVPDFDAIVIEYTKNKSLEKVLGLLYGGQNYEHNFHYCTFNFETLKNILEECGFCDIEKYDWKTFLPHGYDDFSRAYLPHMDFEHGRLMSLNILAKK